ncbi:MAG: FAD-binding oxidoreductase [Parcubacteria group bacterium CG11_big_fil_rev_8_21_14_0_20_39_22]|nr:MAG: FAD-binding oxidoreductase [Parcubacteria group bacterium CG11_big_fil_rev_8_21_14_0_20_39_22]
MENKNSFEGLKRLVEGEVKTDEDTLTKFGLDASIFEVRPSAVVFPKIARDVEASVRFVDENKKRGATEMSITARSAGSDMSGGPLSESLILSCTEHLNRIKEITNDFVTLEPGVFYRDLEKKLDQRNLLFPPYPASKDYCAIGGMVSNNSGGEKTLIYGKTADYVKEIKIVLADGKEHTVKPISRDELQNTIEGGGFLGNAYRKLKDLLEKNYDTVKNAKPNVSKNSAGYALWDIWDREIFNPQKLFVGSQGTLGIITEATLSLVPKKKYSRLVVVFAKDLNSVPAIVKSLLPFKPQSIESYDDRTLGLAMKFLPSLIKMMKGNIITLGLKFIPELMMILRGGFPKMVMLVELSSDDKEDLKNSMNSIEETLKQFPVEVRLIKSKKEEEKYWTIRRQSFALLHSKVKGKYAAAFVDDIIVRPEYMPEFLPKVNAVLEKYGSKLIYTIAGHPGDGNFHIIPLIDLSDPEMPDIITNSIKEIYTLVKEYDGSISGEHNDGLVRTPFLDMMYSEEIIKLFKQVKDIFDPDNIFNPGKKVDGDWQYSLRHLRKE